LQRFGLYGLDFIWFGVASQRRASRFERRKCLCDL